MHTSDRTSIAVLPDMVCDMSVSQGLFLVQSRRFKLSFVVLEAYIPFIVVSRSKNYICCADASLISLEKII